MFQTVDTDFSPGDKAVQHRGEARSNWFQTVDTDFSPGDAYGWLYHPGESVRFRPLTRISLLVTSRF